jgi:tetratricopeptide (TPR) repeat protein
MSGTPLYDLIAASRQARLDLTPDEWRDVWYLAAHTGARRPAEEPATSATAGVVSSESIPQRPYSEPASPSGPRPPQPPPRPDPGPYASMSYVGRRGGGTAAGVRVRTPTVSALSRVAFGKAFRGLKRTVDAPDEFELDVPATTRQAADADLWDPVLVPAPDRWLHVAVVVDDAASGPAWSQEIAAFLQALEDSGAFGGVRVWHFDSDTPSGVPLTVRGGTDAAVAGRDNRELIDPSGRRAVLVLSDCVGAGWGDGRIAGMVESWSAMNPVAVVNLLPQRLWARCRPRLVSVDWRSIRPFTVGGGPQWRPRRGTAGAGAGSMIPVFDLTEDAMARWAALVAGTTGGWVPGVALFTADVSPAGPTPEGDDDGDDVAGMAADRCRLRVARFQAVASPPAFRLATLLATAPLQPPVIRMIQQAALRTDQPTYWAEVLLSGLVDRVDDAPNGNGDPHEPYDFAEGVREQLLTGLTRREALEMLCEISDFVSTRLGGALDFLALLGLDGAARITPADRPFARVAVRVLEALGGSYAERARHLSALLDTLRHQHKPHGRIGTITDYWDRGSARSTNGDLVTAPNVTETRRYGRRETSSRTEIWDAPPKIVHFTGRRELLDSLRRELVENPNQAAVLVPRALFGLGGVGKSALANEYAYRYGGEYDVVWWIPAEDPADVRRSLVQLSRLLHLPEFTDQAQTIRRLLTALETAEPKRRWLLIYDNATSPASLVGQHPDRRDALMPIATRHGGHVLVTSRDPSWREHGTMLQVDTFTRDESTALLRRRAKAIAAEDADRLADLLEDLPLALNQAAAWHEETQLPTSEYLRRYAEVQASMPSADLLPEYPRAVGATFSISYEHLRGRSRAAAQLLQLCSQFGPEAIAVDMLWRGRYAPDLPSPLRARMLDRTWLKRELKAISRYELIQFDQGRDRFQLHRLVQRILRGTAAVGERETTPEHAQAILAQANPGNPDEIDVQDLAKHAELSPHILPSNIIASTDPEARKVVLDQIRYRYLIGDYEGSRDLARLAVEDWERRFGPDDVQLLLTKRHLAMTLRASGEPAEALDLNEHVLAQFQRLLGSDHEHTLATGNGYASVLRTMGRFREALEIDRENLDRYRAILRNDDPDTLRAANNYAVDLRLIGDFRAAQALDEETVRLWTETLGSDHPETLFAISNLVRDLYGLGQYGDAISTLHDAIAAQQALLSPTHPSVLMARRTMAMLTRKLGQYGQARDFADSTYAAYLARFPESHENSLAAMMSLANALRDENRDRASMRRARELCERALELYRRSFPGHPFVYVCQANLALILRACGEVAEARRLNTDAEVRLRELLGVRHPYSLCAATNLASDHAAAGDYAAACRLSEATLEISRDKSIRGPDHPYTLGCALNHALDLEAVGRTDEAVALWRRTHAGFVAVLGPVHPDTLHANERRRVDADIEPPPT